MNIVGSATCSFGSILKGHDGDGCRANRLEDGRVFCVFCGVIGPSTFDALNSAAGGYTPLTRHPLGFSAAYRDGGRASIFCDGAADFKVEQGDPSIGSDFDAMQWPGVPESLVKVATALAVAGYRVTNQPDLSERTPAEFAAARLMGFDFIHTLHTLIMVHGAHIAGDRSKAILGPKIELTYGG